MSEDLKHTPEILSAKDLQDMGFSCSMSYALFNRKDIYITDWRTTNERKKHKRTESDSGYRGQL